MKASELVIGAKYKSTAFKNSVQLVSIDELHANDDALVTVAYYGKLYTDCAFRLSQASKRVNQSGKRVEIGKTARKPYYVVNKIKWDTDGVSAKELGLPRAVELPETLNIDSDDINGYLDDVANYLSDEYGYCVFDFNVVKKYK